MSILSQVSGGPVLIRPRRSIGGLFPDIVVEEQHEDTLEITEHPVEQGANINDHAFKKAESVTIRAGVSDASSVLGGEKPSTDFYEKLLELQKKREPFDLVTGKRLYKNMLLESLSAITDQASENCLMFTAQCREVIIVKTQVTSVPPRKNHASPGKTGATEDKGQKQAQPRQGVIAAGAGGGRYKRPGGAAPGYGG
ncbi:MAG: hypothetical protein FWG04_02595 [Desulfovibrionaceae bacterium]|nr:hypothetical protein [Desulfovibrionaceae bacterium]